MCKINNKKFKIGGHFNTYNTSLFILTKQGFKLSVTGQVDDDGIIISDSLNWTAENDELIVYASNPLELLGLTEIHKHLNPNKNRSNWWVVEEDVLDKILDLSFQSEI